MRFVVAGVALVILLASVLYSKSQATSFGEDVTDDAAQPVKS